MSEAKSLPTTEVSTSATGAEEDLEIMVITGLSGGIEENPDDDEKPELETLADPEGEALGNDLVSIVDIGPTEFSEAGPTRPQAQRQIRFYTDEEPQEALERETNKIATARLVKGLMIRTGERHPSERG